MKNLFIYSFIVLLVLYSCEYNVENEEVQVVNNECETEVSYSNTIRPLITTNCMPCHDGNSTSAPDLTTYTLVKNLDILIRQVTQTRRMPRNGTLTDGEIAAIKCWVDNGALNN